MAQVVLLERIDNLGQMGEVVTVKPGFARNYLLPQKKALRATKENIAYFEAQRKVLEADNEKRRKEAEKDAKKLEGLKVVLLRAASEAGQLFGSVTSRDIAEKVTEKAGIKVDRSQVELNQNVKEIGLLDVSIALHPEVKVNVTINIARTEEEADVQAETGHALVAGEGENLAEVIAEEESNLEEVLEEDALEAEKEKQAKAAEAEAEEAEKAEKAAEKAAKKAAKKAESAEEESDDAEQAPAEEAEEKDA